MANTVDNFATPVHEMLSMLIDNWAQNPPKRSEHSSIINGYGMALGDLIYNDEAGREYSVRVRRKLDRLPGTSIEPTV